MPRYSPYPAASLEQARRVIDKIHEVNSGNQITPIELAKAMDSQPKSGPFRSLVSASTKFGLTKGQYSSRFIVPTERARYITDPAHEGDDISALIAAFRSVEAYQVLEKEYASKPLPNNEFGINNTARLLGLEKPAATKCWQRFTSDCNFLDWLVEIKGRKYLQPKDMKIDGASADSEGIRRQAANGDDSSEDSVVTALSPDTANVQEQPRAHQQSQASVTEPLLKPSVFIAHFEKRGGLALKVKELLAWLDVDCHLAEFKSNMGQELIKKVFDLINECSYGIVLLTKDIELMDGSFMPSPSVSYEVGHCYGAYQGRVLVLVEKDTSTGAILGRLAHYEFEGDNVGSVMPEVYKELKEFGLIRIGAG